MGHIKNPSFVSGLSETVKKPRKGQRSTRKRTKAAPVSRVFSRVSLTEMNSFTVSHSPESRATFFASARSRRRNSCAALLRCCSRRQSARSTRRGRGGASER